MSRKENSTIYLSTKQIKDLYNIYKQVKAKDLPQLAKTYKDNLKTIIVLMKTKPKGPRITLSDLMKEIKSIKDDVKSIKTDIAKINVRIDNLDKRLTAIVKANNLIDPYEN